MVFIVSKESDVKEEQRFVKSILVVLMTSLTIGAPYMGYVLYKQLGMPLSQALVFSLVTLIIGVLLLLLWNRKDREL